MKGRNPIRTLMEELRKDTRRRVDLSPEEARRRAALAAGFRRLNAWKKKVEKAQSTHRPRAR